MTDARKQLRAAKGAAARRKGAALCDWLAEEIAKRCWLARSEVAREYRFHPTRRWRFDIAVPFPRFALEVEGGVYVAGRHARGAGFEADCEKYAEAMVLGWRVLRVTTRQVKNGQAVAWATRILGGPPCATS